MAFDAILCRFLQRCLTYKRNRFCPQAFCLFLSHHSFGLRYLLHHHLHHYCCCHLHHHYRLILRMKLFSRCSLYDQSLELGKSLGFEKWKNTKMGEKPKSNAHAESRMIAQVYAAIAAVRSKKCLVKRYFVGNLSTVGCALPILLFALCLVPFVLRQSK